MSATESRARNFPPEIAASLRANRLDPKLLYATPRQAGLWREVARRHSPVQGDPDFQRIYEEAFSRMVGELPRWLELVGLGCGTGEKEARLYGKLAGEREIFFTAIDISPDLVEEAAGRLAALGAQLRAQVVGDLAEPGAWREALNEATGRRLVTFFGLVPNFPPSQLGSIWRAALRPGDLLLASVHLAPATSPGEMKTALRVVLPQYDNPETLAWLAEALRVWKLDEFFEPPEMVVGEVEGVAAFLGRARWKSGSGEPFQLFRSLRYTPESFATLLRREGFEGNCLAMTECRQEGIWTIRLS
jgi:SAM-dependent methyltransferase